MTQLLIYLIVCLLNYLFACLLVCLICCLFACLLCLQAQAVVSAFVSAFVCCFTIFPIFSMEPAAPVIEQAQVEASSKQLWDFKVVFLFLCLLFDYLVVSLFV